MPIFRAGNSLNFFAHVPKCGGSAVENYLMKRFGPLAFQDRRFFDVPADDRWLKSSPQHAPAAALARLFPPGFFLRSFAVVRHPHDRMISVFRYQRDVMGQIDARVDFGDWLHDLPETIRRVPSYLDIHPRPMTHFVPEEAQIFRLETDLPLLVDWLDTLAGNRIGLREIAVTRSYSEHIARVAREPGPPAVITPRVRDLIAELYADDFVRFGYDPMGSDSRAATG